MKNQRKTETKEYRKSVSLYDKSVDFGVYLGGGNRDLIRNIYITSRNILKIYMNRGMILGLVCLFLGILNLLVVRKRLLCGVA